MSSISNTHTSFETIRSHRINSLNIEVTEYKHIKTGAQHIHLAADHAENVFLVALRTLPENSTGVAHILEHTALCGSEKYPVRDPFFMMIRRSLNSFMNAFTSSDWTAYPFASQNRKDFDNLLSVYLDAVFFSRLDPLDFAQEGHRLDFAEPGNLDSDLVYKGVVYNEMKGAMSSVTAQLWQCLSRYVFPESSYHFNSGGDPEAIVNLSYDELQRFYKTHYHPSNAIFMTFGNIPALELHAQFEALALGRFKKREETIRVLPEKRYHAPIRVEEAYPFTRMDKNDDIENQSHIVIGWLLGPSTNLKSNLEAHLLSSLMYDNSASPLLHMLETSELGASPSPLCGIDDSQLEMLFVCGLAGTAADSASALEEAVLSKLNDVATAGLPQDQVEASLHQLELQQREIGGDSYPYGLQLILNALPAATHRGDAIALLDLENALNELRRDIQSPDYIKQLVKRLLLENNHRVTLTLRPDEDFQEQQQTYEKNRLASLKASLDNNDLQTIAEQAEALEQRQQQTDDTDILPKVSIEDIPRQTPFPTGFKSTIGQRPLTYYNAGTNGLVYQQYICPLSVMDSQLLETLPYYVLCLTEVGLGNQNYLNTQRRQSQVVGGINSYYSLRNRVDDNGEICSYMTLSAKALRNNQSAMNELMRDTLATARFDERQRIKDLIAQTRTSREQSITSNGHILAMQVASAGVNTTAQLIHQLTGLGGLQSLKKLDQSIDDRLDELLGCLQALHQRLLQTDRQWLLIGEKQQNQQYIDAIKSVWRDFVSNADDTATSHETLTADRELQTIQQAWIVNSQVHFCAKAFPTVPMDHPDAAALSVLGGTLRNGYLHRAIREQGGAYGGGASQDNETGCFRFYSYRDPRMTGTLSDFDKAVHWLFDQPISRQQVEESILGLISTLDKPSSPAGEAKSAFHGELTGRTQEKRQQYRERVIDVNADDLRRVADTYLQPEKANTAIITGAVGKEEATRLGLEIITL